jgi:hypothetical protein
MSPADAFDILRAALEQGGIRYAIGGSWASTAFGEPRFTNDVDILADLTQENVARPGGALPISDCHLFLRSATFCAFKGRSAAESLNV